MMVLYTVMVTVIVRVIMTTNDDIDDHDGVIVL